MIWYNYGLESCGEERSQNRLCEKVALDGSGLSVRRPRVSDRIKEVHRKVIMKMKCMLAAFALGLAASVSAGAPKMKAILTVPHEFDMLLKSGHIQGLACSEEGIYLSHQEGLAKIGWDGKLLKHIETPRHLGGIAFANGKIYGSFILRAKEDMIDGKPGLLRVWDENLNQVAEKSFQETAGAVGVLGDTIYYAIGYGKKPHRECSVKRLGLDLSDRGNQTFDFGYDIKYGIQAIATDGESLICANYGGVSLVNPEFTTFKRLKTPSIAEGFALVPKSVSKRDTPVFIAVRALGGNMKGWRKDPKGNPPRLKIAFYEFDGEKFINITEETPQPGERGAAVAAEGKRGSRKDRVLDFSGSLPESIRTIALVMPASIQPKANFERGKAALEAAGYKVKVMPRLDFEKVAPVEDRVADFEQAWMDPEVDLVLCARGGRGAENLLDKLNWEKLRTRRQRVLGFSNITMILNAMLKENAGRPFSGPTLSQFLYAKRPTFDWLSRILAEDGPMPDVKLRALRPGACSGLACGGHITLVLKGAQMGWAADTKDRIVFLETTVWEPEKTRAMMDELVSRGYFRECAGVVFGDMGHGRSKLTGKALSDSIEEMAQVRRDFAAKATCPVYEDYPYGHISVSYTIDFLRRKTITADGILKQ